MINAMIIIQITIGIAIQAFDFESDFISSGFCSGSFFISGSISGFGFKLVQVLLVLNFPKTF